MTIGWQGGQRVETGEVVIRDMLGRVVYRVGNVRSDRGENRYVLHVPIGMSSGMYRVEVMTPTVRVTAPLNVQK